MQSGSKAKLYAIGNVNIGTEVCWLSKVTNSTLHLLWSTFKENVNNAMHMISTHITDLHDGPNINWYFWN